VLPYYFVNCVAIDESKSGRWNCYYSDEQLAAAVEDSKRAREQWDNFAQRELARASSAGPARTIGQDWGLMTSIL
jgi:hypothetical protein